MTFLRIIEKDDGRILGSRIDPNGFEIALCRQRADGHFEPIPGLRTVMILRSTRQSITHALTTLDWDKEDMRHVYAFLHDPRLMMPRDYPLHRLTLPLPAHVTKQDGYLQLASVWGLNGPVYAACISDIANQPDKWGTQIAALMENLVTNLFENRGERSCALDVIAAAYRDALAVRKINNPTFASRYDWANAEQGMEIMSVWVSTVPGTRPIQLTCDAAVLSLAQWGVALAVLASEIVDTLAAEHGESHQEVFAPLDVTYKARLSKAYAAIEPGIVPHN